MDDSELGKSILITIGIFIIAVICWLSAGYIIKNPDEILYQTTDSLYVKQYKIYNTDSIVCAFKKPQQYVGVISYKYTYRQLKIIGVTSYFSTCYNTTIIYDNKTYTTNSSEIYHEYNEGDKVIIDEVFYPKYNIQILRKYDTR